MHIQKVVIDTDIIIDFLRTKSGLFISLLQEQQSEKIKLYLSSITVFELFAGNMKPQQKTLLKELMANFRIIPFGQKIAAFAGEIKQKKRTPIALADYLIGITAVYYKARLATRNKKHFKNIPNLKFYS